ncbi:Phycobilisome 31.8 kDa linker polypeptide, phycoerythrin-associated, rod [Gracilariopsis chorda]|uniref:Phycobilisome 31.8 kDa linker polypeptide, phycoerythrin-associated, rod n=1 Tax=Gracilariopsis chorda TaxID=448386 RepID=A0A2V3IPZ5_9FLOR|nr:Phycobilisome 31.8 kDa linker polypeptide, phycoerythrin-associated, rod [Gracilariopsis chorda]|eukprot:PXF44129.1 Phycobilisome 31.8 kDa linker polypeptide, phycoerythrin-associated, rod [Gracilariopsis chorda]
MAFVPVLGLRPSAAPLSTTFTGTSLRTSAPSAQPRFTARLGTVLGNSSLDKLGLDKFTERFVIAEAGRPAGFSADYEVYIQAIYRQVFGNAYIMESERAEMSKLESEFRDLRLTAKEFCRALGKTYQYRKRFFDSRPLYGAIELNFKHFLGRTPDGLEQYRAKSAVYDSHGYDAFIDAFFDDGEYDAFFDQYCVPYYRGHLTTSNLSMCAFTHMFQVVRGSSTSDKANPRTMTNKITLNRAGIQSIPLPVVAPGADGGNFMPPDASSGSWQGGVSGASMARTSHGTRQAGGKIFRIEVTNLSQAKANNGGAGVRLRSRTGRFYKTKNASSGSKISDFRRSNTVYMVPFNELSATYIKIHKNGGVIASITPVTG